MNSGKKHFDLTRGNAVVGTLEVSKYQGLDNQGKIANVFTATGSQSLKAVAVNMWDEAVTYTVDIYKNPTNAKNPTSGTLETSKSGYFEHPGYFTVELDNPVSLAEGDKFAVVFTLSCPEVDPDDKRTFEEIANDVFSDWKCFAEVTIENK